MLELYNAEAMPVTEKPCFHKNEALSHAFTALLDPKFDEGNVHQDSRLKCSVFFNSSGPNIRNELTQFNGETDLDAFLAAAEKADLRVALYSAGIFWTGLPKQCPEIELARSVDLIDDPQEKLKHLAQVEIATLPETGFSDDEAEGSETMDEPSLGTEFPALDFLARSGYDVCVTLEPAGEDSDRKFIASLRADAAAKEVVYDTLRERKIVPESVNWSYGAFVEFQTHRAACETIAQDLFWATENGVFTKEQVADLVGSEEGCATLFDEIARAKASKDNAKVVSEPDLNKRDVVFDNGSQALEHLKRLDGMDIYLGGTPATAGDLAFPPFFLTHSTPIYREIVDTLRRGTNELVRRLGRNDAASHFQLDRGPVSNIVLSRMAEIGRARELDQQLVEKMKQLGLWEAVFSAMHTAVGDTTRIVCFGDSSGKSALSDRMTAATNLEAIYGTETVIPVETQEQEDYYRPVHAKEGRKLATITGEAEHNEMKRDGVLNRLGDFIRYSRNGYSREELSKRFSKGRYRVISNLNNFYHTNRSVRRYSPV